MKPADEERELTRLLATEADERSGELALLRARGPDAAELASLASRLALQGVDVTTPSASPPAEMPWKKWAIGGAGAASAVLLWLALRAPQPVPLLPRPVAPAAELAPPAASHAAAEVKPPPSLDSPARPPAVGVVATPPSVTPPNREAPAPQTEPDGASPSAAPTSLAGGSSPAPPGGNQRFTSSAAPAAPASSSAAVTSGPAALPTEIELLRDARFALKQSPARALELSDQHARLYPRGKLTQERELLAITALVSLGRRTAALSRGAAFERAFPRSPYIEQLNDLLR